MRSILKYIISLSLVFVSFVMVAQEPLQRQTFVRVGLDVSRFALPYINDFGPNGLEVSLDTEIKYRFFPTLEAGFTNIEDHTDLHHYNSNGNYFRVGFNYNLISYKHRLDRNLFFIGARFAYTAFSHEANNILISNGWGDFEASFDKTQLNAYWFEGVMGLRAEIIKNFYMGFTIRIKSMISHSDYNNYTPFWIPGYGEATKNVAVGMSYSVFYAIPIKNPKLDFE